MPPRIVAIDWSGAASGAERKIWLAEFDPAAGGVTRLESGRSRDAITRHLLEIVAADPHVVIGLDFAFSFPAWLLQDLGVSDAPAAWSLVAREGERWLADCHTPFWGRPGRRKPVVPEHFRRTERTLPAVAGIRPKSVLQIGGAGAVGTGSLRGMPFLLRLRDAGCAIWPFDEARFPMVVEIYPRLLTGRVVKGARTSRADYLAAFHPALDHDLHALAAGSEDAFDALLSALAMGAAAGDFNSLGAAPDEIARLEGEIWRPASPDSADRTAYRAAEPAGERVADRAAERVADRNADRVALTPRR